MNEITIKCMKSHGSRMKSYKSHVEITRSHNEITRILKSLSTLLLRDQPLQNEDFIKRNTILFWIKRFTKRTNLKKI